MFCACWMVGVRNERCKHLVAVGKGSGKRSLLWLRHLSLSEDGCAGFRHLEEATAPTKSVERGALMDALALSPEVDIHSSLRKLL
jgi:hypothetical protein